MKIFSDKKTLIPCICALIGALLMIITVFLPYSTAIGEYKAELKTTADTVISEDLGMDSGDLINVSMFDYARIYSKLTHQMFYGKDGYIYVGFVVAILLFSVLCILFSLLKKATPIIVFSMLSFLVFAFQSFDFYFRDEIPNENYAWGFGYYIFYFAAALTLAGAIWLLIVKVKNKKMHS